MLMSSLVTNWINLIWTACSVRRICVAQLGESWLHAPAQLAQLLLLAATEGEFDNATNEFQRYLGRSDVLLISWNILDAAHWVLIALEAANANVPVSSRRALQMCRVEAEQAVREALYPLDAFEPVSRDDGERWIVRYYDSLKEPSVTCALQADKLLTLLSLPTRPLECTNAAKQGDGWSCGYWVRFFAEEEMRRYHAWEIPTNQPILDG